MDKQLIQIIEHLLVSHESVAIPSLGAFVLHRRTAEVSLVEGRVHPPHVEVRFQSIIFSGDTSLRDALTARLGLTPSQAEQRLAKFVRDIKHKLELGDIVYFGQIGKMFLDHDGEIAFQSSYSLPDRIHFGLQQVQLRPITGGRLRKESPGAKNSAPQSKRRSPEWAINAGLTAAFLLLAIGIFFFVRNGLQKPSGRPIAQNVHVNVSPIPSPTLPVMDPADNIDMELKEDNKSKAPTTPALEVEDKLSVQETKARPVQGHECVIIAGTFSSDKDASALIRKLIDDGFAPYKDRKGHRWRVGIIFGYDSIYEVKEKLEFLIDNYNENAWILRK